MSDSTTNSKTFFFFNYKIFLVRYLKNVVIAAALETFMGVGSSNKNLHPRME
jgi:hypothetical protein